jgi:5-methylcytosine-specific restriction endonuclease McrA
MTERTCEACGKRFIPTAKTQRACPPSDHDRARAAGRQARSRCAVKVANAAYRKRPVVIGEVGLPFDCAHCGKPCTPGVDVPAHASRFCSSEHKAAWHKTPRSITLTAEPTSRSSAAYCRAMRADPCAYCGAPSQALDHIVPRSDGGSNDWTNRTGVCSSCNSTKQQSPLLIFLGWRQARDAFEPWRQIVATIHTRT